MPGGGGGVIATRTNVYMPLNHPTNAFIAQNMEYIHFSLPRINPINKNYNNWCQFSSAFYGRLNCHEYE